MRRETHLEALTKRVDERGPGLGHALVARGSSVSAMKHTDGFCACAFEAVEVEEEE